MPTAVAAARQSYADHPMVRLETAPPGPCHAVSLQETLSGTFTACATVILRANGHLAMETRRAVLLVPLRHRSDHYQRRLGTDRHRSGAEHDALKQMLNTCAARPTLVAGEASHGGQAPGPSTPPASPTTTHEMRTTAPAMPHTRPGNPAFRAAAIPGVAFRSGWWLVPDTITAAPTKSIRRPRRLRKTGTNQQQRYGAETIPRPGRSGPSHRKSSLPFAPD